jgi:hypothetical protein
MPNAGEQDDARRDTGDDFDYEFPDVGNTREAAEGLSLVEVVTNRAADRGGLGYVFRRQPEADGGIDGHMEIIGVETAEGAMSARILSVQVKAGPSFISRQTDEDIPVYIEKATVHAWRTHTAPVVLLVADLDAEKVYWVRVDEGSFHETRKYYRIHVPNHQVLDSTARVALRGIALSRLPPVIALLDPPDLATERAELQAAEARAATDAEWTHLAEGHLQFSAKLAALNRHRDAATRAGHAAKCFRRGRDFERGAIELTRAMRKAVHELHDGELARRIEMMTLAPDRIDASGEHPPRRTTLSPNVLRDLLIVEAQAQLLNSETAAAVALGERLVTDFSPSPTLPDSDDHRAIRATAHLLLARGAVINGLYTKAAEYTALAAAESVDDVQKVRFGVHALLQRALGGDADAAYAALAALTVPTVVEPSKLRALGWIATLRRDFDGAAATFLVLARLMTRENDHLGAEQAYEAAAWADQGSSRFLLGDSSPAAIAHRIASAGRVSEKRTAKELVGVADQALRAGRLNDAYSAATRALVLAHHEIDPVTADRAHLRLAECWRRATEEEQDADTFVNAALLTGMTRVQVRKEDVADLLGPFYVRLRERHSDDTASRIAIALTEPPLSLPEQIGGVRVLAEIADLVPNALIEPRVVPAIRSCLAAQWVRTGHDSAAEAACQLIYEISERLPTEIAAEFTNTLVGMLPTTPPTRRSKLLSALIGTIGASSQPIDGGAALANTIFGMLDDESYSHDRQAIHSVLAALASKADEATRVRIESRLNDAARSGDWFAFEDLHHFNLRRENELTDRYLTSLEQALDARLASAGGQSYGVGLPHPLGLVKKVASTATPTVRERVLAKALDLIENRGYVAVERASWVGFAGALAKECEALRSRTIGVLAGVASSGLPADGNADFRGGHVLGRGSHVLGAHENQVRAIALGWLSPLSINASSGDVQLVDQQLDSAVADPAPELRGAAADAAGWLAVALLRTDQSGAANISARVRGLKQLLLRLSEDRAESVRLRALGALTSIARECGLV